MEFIREAITIIIIAATTYLLYYFSRKPANQFDRNSIVLEYSIGVRLIFIFIASLLPIIFLLAMLFKIKNYTENVVNFYVVLELLFIVFILYLILRFRKEKIYITSSGIDAYYLLYQNKKFKWNEIASISYSKLSSSIIIMDHSGRKIKVNQFLSGFDDFIKMVAKKVPVEIHRNSIYEVLKHPLI